MRHFNLLITLSLAIFRVAPAIEVNHLYDTTRLDNLEVLQRGDDLFNLQKLDVPVHFYTDKYDLIYVR